MNIKHIGLVSCAGLLLLCVFIGIASVTISSASVTELNVPSWVVQGEEVSISGKAAANEEVWIGSSFEIVLPVSDGKYSRDFIGIDFPGGEKVFSVTAENVKDIRISLSPIPFLGTVEYPLEGPKNATNGVATLSVSFPAEIYGFEMDIHGKKDVKVYGDAADDATSVNLKIATSIKVIADSTGDFTFDISTEGVPLGEFLITAGGIEKTVEVVLTEPTPTPTPSPSPSPTPTLTPTPTPSSNGGDGSGDGDGTPDTTPTPSPSSSPTPTPTSTPTTTLAPTATPAAASPTVTPSPSPTPSPSASPSQRWIPGFEAVFAIAGLLAVAYLVLRKRE